MTPAMPERERIKRQFLNSHAIAAEYEFCRHLKPLDFQVWCMMIEPRDLLVWSNSDEFQRLSRRVHNTHPILEAWDWFMRRLYWPVVL